MWRLFLNLKKCPFIMCNAQVLLIILLATTCTSEREEENLVATSGQIKIAEENQYDQTGPGAKKYEGAFKTYSAIEEAILSYADDPDTKLPFTESENAFRKPATFKGSLKKLLPVPNAKNSFPSLTTIAASYGNNYAQNLHSPGPPLPRYAISQPQDHVAYSPALDDKLHSPPPPNYGHSEDIPRYTYGYGVHDDATGDSKSAHESRVGDRVNGFYTVVDPDGHQRTVKYSADDAHGFRAEVQRVPTRARSVRGYAGNL